ncbi:MAG: hypothetical protein RL033_8079, partial [Pseudomonadota bacterium]
MTSPRRPSPPPNAATVVAGTPKLASAAKGVGTAPLGLRKGATSESSEPAAAPVTAPLPLPPALGQNPRTTPGAGAFEPSAAVNAARARRAGLWATVVGVGPSFLKNIAANNQRARDEQGADRASSKPKARSPRPEGVRSAASRDAASRDAASRDAAPIDSDMSAVSSAAVSSAAVNSAATRVSLGVPKLAAPTVVSPVGSPRSPLPSSRERESHRESDREPRRESRRESKRASARPQPHSQAHSAPQSLPESGPSEPGLFRKAVVEARRGDGPEVDFLAGFKPKGWSVLMLLASLVALLFVGAALATVEVTAEAQGMLRAPKGLRPVASVLGGSLSEVLVQSGDQVQPGQVVARLEATELRANLVTRERELETTQQEVTEADRRDRQIEERASQAMQRRRAALQG